MKMHFTKIVLNALRNLEIESSKILDISTASTYESSTTNSENNSTPEFIENGNIRTDIQLSKGIERSNILTTDTNKYEETNTPVEEFGPWKYFQQDLWFRTGHKTEAGRQRTNSFSIQLGDSVQYFCSTCLKFYDSSKALSQHFYKSKTHRSNSK